MSAQVFDSCMPRSLGVSAGCHGAVSLTPCTVFCSSCAHCVLWLVHSPLLSVHHRLFYRKLSMPILRTTPSTQCAWHCRSPSSAATTCTRLLPCRRDAAIDCPSDRATSPPPRSRNPRSCLPRRVASVLIFVSCLGFNPVAGGFRTRSPRCPCASRASQREHCCVVYLLYSSDSVFWTRRATID